MAMHLESKEPGDCSNIFKGTARKTVKLRTKKSGKSYKSLAGGKVISVAEWLEIICSLDEDVPEKIPSNYPISGVENKKVTIKGFLLGAKYEADQDQDIHAEISDEADWNSDHIVIEIPPGQPYCEARRALWNLVQDDPAPLENYKKILQHPVEVSVSGYVFLDATHGKDNRCEENGGRGIKNGKKAKSKVVGLYEIHPVLELYKID